MATPELVVGRPARGDRVVGARRALASVALAAVLANATWFSATAVVPALEHDWRPQRGRRGLAGRSWSRSASSPAASGRGLLNLPDRLEPRGSSAGRPRSPRRWPTPGCSLAGRARHARCPSRFLVGVALAGVYAPGVRLVATYFERGRGVATGVVVGALTLGSATPHLVRGVGHVPWQATIVDDVGARASLAAVAIRPVPRRTRRAGRAAAGPRRGRSRAAARPAAATGHPRLPRPHVGALRAVGVAGGVLRRRPATRPPGRPAQTGAVAFLAIGVAGLLGAVAAGRLADRLGRTATTSGAMLLSAACCLASPLAFARRPPVLVARAAGLGRVRDRRLGAVLGRGHRARRAPLRRLGARPCSSRSASRSRS